MTVQDKDLKIAGVILAAGNASRFGSDKRLAKLNNSTTILEQSIHLFTQCCDEIFVILKPKDQQALTTLLGGHLDRKNLHPVYSNHAELGMGNSLSDAIVSIESFERDQKQSFAGILLGLADMPYIGLSSIQAVLASKSPRAIVTPYIKPEGGEKKMGHPVWFDRCWFEELKLLKGDRGGRSIINNNPQARIDVKVEDAGILLDIDQPADLK